MRLAVLAHRIVKGRALPLLERDGEWSIGIKAGASPFELRAGNGIQNPVLTRRDVTGVRASSVADPFMIRHGDGWFMFFEISKRNANRGVIGCASSGDGFNWRYESVVLKEDVHLSYPSVFSCNGDFFMTPETREAGEVRLYQASEFPFGWRMVQPIVAGEFVDPTIVQHAGEWWLFAATMAGDLHLFGAEHPLGLWREHPKSPIIRRDLTNSRPAGRFIGCGGKLFRLAQDDGVVYGQEVRAFEILELSPEEYRETAVPVTVSKPSGWGWARELAHHVDAHAVRPDYWIACVDGYRSRWRLRRPRR